MIIQKRKKVLQFFWIHIQGDPFCRLYFFDQIGGNGSSSNSHETFDTDYDLLVSYTFDSLVDAFHPLECAPGYAYAVSLVPAIAMKLRICSSGTMTFASKPFSFGRIR